MVGKIVEIHLDAAVVRNPDHLVDLVQKARLAVRGHAHDLVLAVVDAKAKVGGKGGIEQPDRMGKAQLVPEFNAVFAVAGPVGGAFADGGGGPLADAVYGDDGGLVKGGGKHGAGGVGDVVVGEEYLAGRDANLVHQGVLDPELVTKEIDHRLAKDLPGARHGAHGA